MPRRKTTPAVPTRDRILEATAQLMRRKGYTATGLKEIVTVSQAPFGSVYHFFPEGKEQLGAEAIRVAGRQYNALVAGFFDGAPDVVDAVRDFFDTAAEVLRQTDYEDACPIATVALEVASTSETMREAAAEAFESWITDAVGYFEAAGIGVDRARELAVLAFMLLEGAFLLCRTWKSTEPMEIAGRFAVRAAHDLTQPEASSPVPQPPRRRRAARAAQ